jgi:hypothetical protein
VDAAGRALQLKWDRQRDEPDREGQPGKELHASASPEIGERADGQRDTHASESEVRCPTQQLKCRLERN